MRCPALARLFFASLMVLAWHGRADASGGHMPHGSDASSRDAAAALALGSRLDSLRSAAHIPGLAVVVMRDTTVLLADGFGYADVERKTPMSADTPSNIASVSKPISAVVALRLVEAGLLDLDWPMHRYAGFAEYCEAVRSEGGLFFKDFACEDSALTLRHVLSMTCNGTLGTRFFYNPTAYSWASRPMAEVGGRAFSDLVDSLVFRPAGMRQSARVTRSRLLRPELAAALARPYHLDSTGTIRPSDPPPPQGDGAAGGVIATAMDLARFDRALMSDRLISAASRTRMWTPGRSPAGAMLPYGIGWFITDRAGRRLVWHTGLWEGRYSALYLKVPGEGLTLILLANSDGLQFPNDLDEAAIERSAFANAFLQAFGASEPRH